MLFATLIFSSRHWLSLVIVLLAFGIGLLIWSYRAWSAGWAGWLGAFLKALGLAALGWCLLEPLWFGQRAKPGANLFAVVADNSQGLQIKDRGQTRTRGEELRELLTSEREGWQRRLEEEF